MSRVRNIVFRNLALFWKSSVELDIFALFGVYSQLVVSEPVNHFADIFVSGSILGTFLRLCGGLNEFGVGALIKYPFYDDERGIQLFPMRTLSMLCCLTTIIVLSHLSKYLFVNNILPTSADIFRCFQRGPANEEKHKINDVTNNSTLLELQSKEEPRQTCWCPAAQLPQKLYAWQFWSVGNGR